jgi:GxxExxY protein
VTVASADVVIGCAIQVHRTLGPGLFESIYSRCLAHEFGRAGLRFRSDVHVPVIYDSLVLAPAFRADFIVENELLVELKAVERLHPLHAAQVRSYLRLTRLAKGLLINFNVEALRLGLRSVVLTQTDHR